LSNLRSFSFAGLLYEAQGDYTMSFYLAGGLIFVSGCTLLLTPFFKSSSARPALDDRSVLGV
jgi:cytochrome c biogenesis protein CcdA